MGDVSIDRELFSDLRLVICTYGPIYDRNNPTPPPLIRMGRLGQKFIYFNRQYLHNNPLPIIEKQLFFKDQKIPTNAAAEFKPLSFEQRDATIRGVESDFSNRPYSFIKQFTHSSFTHLVNQCINENKLPTNEEINAANILAAISD